MCDNLISIVFFHQSRVHYVSLLQNSNARGFVLNQSKDLGSQYVCSRPMGIEAEQGRQKRIVRSQDLSNAEIVRVHD